MKKYILLIALSLLLIQSPGGVSAEEVRRDVIVTSNSLVDSADGKSVIATFTFNITNIPTSSLIIPENGFRVLLKGKNYTERTPGTILRTSGAVRKASKIYHVSSSTRGAEFQISANFDKSNVYTGSYTAHLDGIYFASEIDPKTSASIEEKEDYYTVQINSTAPLHIVGNTASTTPYDNYTVDEIRLVEITHPETNEPLVVASLKVAVEAKDKEVLIYKKGIVVKTGSGIHGTTTVKEISSNMTDKGNHYVIPAKSVGNIELQSLFSLTDLPHDTYILKVSFLNSEIEKKPLWKKLVSSVKNTFVSIFSF